MKKLALKMAAGPTEQIYIGLDVGSTKVCCIVGLHEEGSAKPSVIGVGVAPTSGMRKGVVVDVDETVSSITAAVDEAETYFWDCHRPRNYFNRRCAYPKP